MMFFTLPAILLSLVLSTLAAPLSLDVDTSHTTTLSPRVTHQGSGTFFYPGLGNCGLWNNSNDPIIAISIDIYGNGGNCGQWVQITNTENGNVAYGQVQDSCESCAAGSLDMSPAVFQQLAALEIGEVPISWHYMNRAWSPS